MEQTGFIRVIQFLLRALTHTALVHITGAEPTDGGKVKAAGEPSGKHCPVGASRRFATTI